MAAKTISLGSLEQFVLYDDVDFPNGLSTDGSIQTTKVPTTSNDVIRLTDVGGGGPAAPADASYLVVSLDTDLSNERRLQGTPGQIILTDNGANNDLVLSTPQNINIDSNVQFNSVEIDGDLNHDGVNVGFFGIAPVAKQAALTPALTSITHTGPGTPDYAIATPTQTTPWGFSTQDEFETIMSVILNLQTRVNELETKLQAYGLLT